MAITTRLVPTSAAIAIQRLAIPKIARIKTIVESTDGAKVVSIEPGYLYAQYTSKLMRFVDDVEFWYDPAVQVVQVRSASRVGKSDLGVNRKRIESVRSALAAAP